MTAKDKTTFIRNLFRFAIGIVFLIACFRYLQKHPAEEIALYSGFKNIIQKAEILSYNLLGKNGELLSQKYALEKQYLNMIHDSEEQGCNDADFLHELHDTYDALLKEEKNHIENYITKYSILASDYSIKIYNECK